jgi:hypothetical protein
MKGRARYLFIAAAGILAVGSVTVLSTSIKTRTDTQEIKLPSIDDVPKACWTALAGKRIFFGHQSVGYNIIDGIRDIVKEHDYIKLNVVETRGPAEFDRPLLAHAQVGRNQNPASKIEDFTNIMDAGIGGKADIAFFKFCYVDVTRNADPKKIFDRYSTAMENLKRRYPRTRFVHVTVPLCSTPKGIEKNLKQCVKSLIGRPGVLDDNLMRERYNELLRDAYSGKEPVFDLALTESINAKGLRCYAVKGTEKVPVLAPEYTDDGGHLNTLGRRKAAEQLLIVLAEISGGS